MKTYGVVDVWINVFLTSALVGGVVSFTPLPLIPRGKSPRYSLERRLGGPQSRSGLRGEEKNLEPTGTRTPTRYTHCAIPAPDTFYRKFVFKMYVWSCLWPFLASHGY
jgi:hypothetical protein